MLEIDCPWCGPRAEIEFSYGGEAHIRRPDPDAASDADWAHYLYFRDNVQGVHAERWLHVYGCRRWFNMVRDTTTYRVYAVYAMGAARPDPADVAPQRQ